MIIVEIGSNHRGSIELADKYIDNLIKTDVDGITFQIREPEFYHGRYKDLGRLTFDDYSHIKKKINDAGKKFGLALCSLNIKKYPSPDFIKILSKDLSNKFFLTSISTIFKNVPIFLSTGMSDEIEIDEAINLLKKNVDRSLIKIIHTCISNEAKDVNLNAISSLKDRFGNIVAFGNHCSNLNVIYASCAYQPTDYYFYVKHSWGSSWNSDSDHPDSLHAVYLYSVQDVCKNIKDITVAIGDGNKKKSKNNIKGQI